MQNKNNNNMSDQKITEILYQPFLNNSLPSINIGLSQETFKPALYKLQKQYSLDADNSKYLLCVAKEEENFARDVIKGDIEQTIQIQIKTISSLKDKTDWFIVMLPIISDFTLSPNSKFIYGNYLMVNKIL